MGDYQMKKFTVVLLTATAFVATPAMASDGQFYFGLGSGVGVTEDTYLEDSAGTVVVDTEWGWEAEALLGYDAGSVRFEVEGSYCDFNLETLDAQGTTIPGFTTPSSFLLDRPAGSCTRCAE
jgi:OOP family OmpA-OmpF porin